MTGLLLLLATLGLLASPVLAWRFTVSGHVAASNPARAFRWRAKLHLRPGPGFASRAELILHWGWLAMVLAGGTMRPSSTFGQRLIAHPDRYAVPLGYAQWHKRVWTPGEDQELMLAPPRVGKTGRIAHRINRHPSAVLATTTRDDLWRLTAGTRERIGPLYVLNPLGVGNVPSNLTWNPLTGCENAATALLRAEDLTLWTDPNSDHAPWQRLAAQALAALMHAAATQPDPARRTMMTVYGWLGHVDEDLIKDVLVRTAGTVEGTVFAAGYESIRRPGKTSDSIRTIMAESLAWVAIPGVLARLDAAPFDPVGFLAERGTIYLMVPGGEESSLAPLFKAFVSNLHRVATVHGSRLPWHRLDPPPLWALDELTQVCPVPLDKWAADSAGKGIQLCAVIHSFSQLVSRYGRHSAESIWSTMTLKTFFGGIHDAHTLEVVSALCGRVTVGEKERPVLSGGALRELPDRRALIIRRSRPPVVIHPHVAFRSRWQRLTGRGKLPPPPPSGWLTPDDDPGDGPPAPELTLPLPAA